MDQNATAPTQQSNDIVQSDVSTPAPSVGPAVNQPQTIPQPQQQVDQILTTTPPSDTPLTTTVPAPVIPAEPAPQPADTPAIDAQSAEPTTDQPQTEQGNTNYIEDVGGSILELLDDIDADEQLQQTLANEMRIDSSQVKSILTGLLDKVDQGQITKDELALLMAAPVVDELPDNQ